VDAVPDSQTGATHAPRPRVEGDREQEILDAALAEVAESGYDKLTLDAVAARARASKATLYRRWSSKAELVVDAVATLKGECSAAADTGTLAGDLAALCGQSSALIAPHQVDVVAGLITAMHRDPELSDAVRRRFLTPHTDLARAVMDRARARGEIAADTDVELLSAVLPALMFFRATTTGLDGDPEELVRRIVSHVVLPAARYGPLPVEGARQS
jgi:AcrR family transcriptional regulator